MSTLPEQVKIYSASPSDMSPPVDDASFCVDFVLAADYAALKAERDQLAAELKQSQIDAGCYKKGMEASNERLVEMAVECAAQQEFIATCFRAAGDGGDMDGNDIQELGERLGLFGRETYQPVLHGYICGHEPGEDTVFVMKKQPATDRFLAEQRAVGVEMFARSLRGEAEITKACTFKPVHQFEEFAYRADECAAQLRNEVKV